MFLGLPQGLSSKESAYKAEDTGDVGLIPGLESSPGGGMENHSSILSWRAHGQRKLKGDRP